MQRMTRINRSTKLQVQMQSLIVKYKVFLIRENHSYETIFGAECPACHGYSDCFVTVL